MTKNKPNGVGQALRLIRNFNSAGLSVNQQVTRANNLLIKFRGDNSLEVFRKFIGKEAPLLVEAASHVISTFRTQRPIVFNPFIVSGYNPDENSFTKALAQMLDPCGMHGFDKAILLCVLDAVKEEAARRGQDEAVNSITRALNLSKTAQIKVQRNYYHPVGLPDLIVTGNGDEKFLIAIENKAPGGSETETLHGLQTNKYYEKILLPLKRKHDISDNHLLAIFLNPSGGDASHPAFLPLSSNDLARTIIAMLDGKLTEEVARGRVPKEIVLAHAFITTFAWLNQGGIQ